MDLVRFPMRIVLCIGALIMAWSAALFVLFGVAFKDFTSGIVFIAMIGYFALLVRAIGLLKLRTWQTDAFAAVACLPLILIYFGPRFGVAPFALFS